MKCLLSYYSGKTREAAGPGLPWKRKGRGEQVSISILYSFISQMTSCQQEQVWWERGLSERRGALLEVMNDAQARAEDSASPPHPSPLSPSCGSFHHFLIWHGCSPKPSARKTKKKKKKVCVGRGGGRRRKRQEEPAPSEAASSGGTFLAGMSPFVLKSNPCCRVGETVVLICASAISSSLGEQSICYWNH